MTKKIDYDVGYGKPPKHTQFKKGICPNPKGRGKRRAASRSIADKVLSEKIEIRENGRLKKITRQELNIKVLVADAVAGDVESAEILLKLLTRRTHDVEDGAILIEVENGLPSMRY